MSKKILKGALAGLIGGLVASFAMNRFQALWTALAVGDERSRKHRDQGGQVKKSRQHRAPAREESETPTTKAASFFSKHLLGRDLRRKEKKVAGALLHYGFGTGVGAAFGAAAEVEPSVAAGGGVPFGAAVWLAADEIGVPAAGLSKPPTEYPLSAHVQWLASHFVYGATTDIVRRMLRQAL